MQLHILNGEGTASSFTQTNIPGDLLIWNELMSQGPTPRVKDLDEFWKIRREYITENFGGTAEEYDSKVLNEYLKLNEIDNYEEVTLWFEHDLTCQVNMMFMLTQVYARYMQLAEDKRPKVYLVCIGEHPQVENFRGLGQLSPLQLAALYPNRQELNEDELGYAARFWWHYASPDPRPLLKIQFENFATFPFLRPAIEAHFSRYPASSHGGLNRIEQLILEAIPESGIPLNELLGKLLTEDTRFGSGDLVLKNYMEALSPEVLVISSDDPPLVTVTETGRKVYDGKIQLENEKEMPERWYGGVKVW